ncbi:SHC SH2 domain-binding protein 1 [Pontoporia blainvillei]|uniref:SHC SH2 domain-binding protein 1 n=1 Tax=Pontoporia blainvillei TaxID=48723 RepID=A0ABX0SD15_PONBL|nr:SHC SH2 domain-binding protein 1 [Pontoporia blainvillei]
MDDGLLAGGGLGWEAMASDSERTGWAVEEEPGPLEKGLFEDEDSCSDCNHHDKPVTDVDFAALKAVGRLADLDPYLCECQVSTFTLECMKELLDLKEHWLQELCVVFDDSGAFDQTALAIERIRLFYQNIWRSLAGEEDEYDYFVRCVEPRLRLHYDILEDQVPSELIVDHQNLLTQREESYRKFLNLRSGWSNCNSDSEQENISMLEGLKFCSEIEQLKRKLKLIENPLLRCVFGYQKNSNIQAKGIRPNGQKVTHVVFSTTTTGLL